MDYRRIILGDHFADGVDKLDLLLSEIQSKYQKWFDERAVITGEEEKLLNYCTVYSNPQDGTNLIHFSVDPIIPDYIASLCVAAFSEAFKQ